MVKIIATCLFLILWPPSRAQFYNSLSAMEVLLVTQEKIIEHIERYQRYITDSKKALVVQKYLSRCRKENELAMWNAEHYLGNPINSYTLIMRLTRDLDHVEKILNETTAGMKYQPDNTLPYPSEEDMVGVVGGMTRIQLMYDIDVQKMANGTLTSIYSGEFVEYTTPMTACDCLELGLVEYEKQDRSRNVAWMKEALRRYELDDVCPINKLDVFDRLSGDYYFMGEYLKTKYWIERRIEASPGDPQNKEYKQAIHALNTMSAQSKPTTIKKPQRGGFDSYPGLCHKVYFSPNASLTCYYAHGPHPFMLLAPIKAEKLHLSPDILLFHEVITDDEILEIQTLAKPRLTTSVSKHCVHKVTWLQNNSSKATLRVAKRIAQFSGLAVDTDPDEDFQVSNYGTGGFYGPHFDFVRPNVTGSCENIKRFATALFYMTDVKVGGAIVFPKLELCVRPVKYAALFWYNLDHNGQNDPRSQHAVCPVLRGSRWVVNSWISLSGQELIRPCPAPLFKQNEPHSPSCSCYQNKLKIN